MAAQEVEARFHVLRALANAGGAIMRNGEFPAFSGPTEYEETSITLPPRARADVVRQVHDVTTNTAIFPPARDP